MSAGMLGQIDRETAAQVLHFFRGAEGHSAGGFRTALFQAFGKADSDNQRRLSEVFPAIGAAWQVATEWPDGLDVLRRIMNDEVLS